MGWMAPLRHLGAKMPLDQKATGEQVGMAAVSPATGDPAVK